MKRLLALLISYDLYRKFYRNSLPANEGLIDRALAEGQSFVARFYWKDSK